MGMLTAAGSLGRSALVVKEFTVNQEGPHYVHIVARRGGIINWLLTLCGINTTTILDIYEDRVLFEHGSLSGKLKSCMPLSAMSVASGGFFKPVIYLFWAFVFFIAAFFHAPPSASKIAHFTPPFPSWLIRNTNALSGCSTSMNVRYGRSFTGFGTIASLFDATPVLIVAFCVTPSSP